MVEFVLVAAIAVGLVLLVVACGPAAGGGRVFTRSFHCPFSEGDVTVEFKLQAPGSTAAVRSCTAFKPATAVACGARCAALPEGLFGRYAAACHSPRSFWPS